MCSSAHGNLNPSFLSFFGPQTKTLAPAQSDYRPELKLKMKNVVSVVIIINKISV